MILSLYRGLTTIAAPLISHYLKKRLARGKEHSTRFPERLGEAGIERPVGKLVWLHGASVGEAVSLLPLIDQIKNDHPNFSILMTTGTITSAALMERRLPEGVIHQFIPVDRLPYVRKFLSHWQPSLAIWLESELWPNLVCETHKRNIPMALINARMSDKSLKIWQNLKGFIATLLGCFDLCLAQTEKDKQRYETLGAKKTLCLGNLKYAAGDLPSDVCDQKDLQYAIGDRLIWLAASTHPGEEVLIGRVHQALRKQFPKILTMIAPRHPERGPVIEQELQGLGLHVCMRSSDDFPIADTDTYIADTMGDMGLLYRIAPIVFMGKSLEPLGGQNPLEPARLDCAVLCGPYMTNFPEIMQRFEEQDAIAIVADEVEMVEKISQLLTHSDQCSDLAARGKKVALAQAAVLGKTMEALSPLIKGAKDKP